jgi:two-component system, cell cycle response regulator
VVLIDLDHFKLLNDTCGHHVPAIWCCSALPRCCDTLRKSDMVCRHGGEEFVAVMPDIDADRRDRAGAAAVDSFSALQPEPQGRRRLPGGSFSAGIALFRTTAARWRSCSRRADKALYLAKHLGRARIEQPPATGFFA